MAHYYEKDGKQYASVTTIIKDCTNSSGPLTQWAANMATQYIEEWRKKNEYCDRSCGSWVVDSELLSEVLDDARFNFKEVSQKALDIGSEVHNAIEMYLKYPEKYENEYPKLSTLEAREAFRAFMKWQTEHDLKPISLEQTVYGDRWAGTLDFYGHFNGKLYVIDWKSSKAHYPEMRYQVAAYRSAENQKWLNVCEEKAEENIRLGGTFWQAYEMYKEEYCPVGCGVLRLDKETGMPDFKDTSKTYEQDLKIFNAMVDLYLLRHPRISKKLGRE